MSKMDTKLKKEKENELNVITTDLEFFGERGCLTVLVVSPLFLVVQFVTSSFTNNQLNLTNVSNYFSTQPFFSSSSVVMYLSWLLYHLVMWYMVPGKLVSGLKLKDGSKQVYKQNGFNIFLLTQLLTLSVYLYYGSQPFLYIISSGFQLLNFSILFCLCLSTYLYVRSLNLPKSTLLSPTGNSGLFIHDFWMGRELNPSFGSLDLKEFCELRPGLMGWALLNWSYLIYQLENNGTITYSLLLVVLCQVIYVGDALYNQAAVLTTMDITTDGFGFMLVFGDISFVPFLYTIQSRYLANNPIELNFLSASLILIAAFSGYSIFRGANNQKNQFKLDRTHSSVKHLKYIESPKGNKLLVEGYWGIASHINYLGDWLLSLAQCLACGFDSFVPYLFVIYFAILLVHRDSRDDHQCSLKYGDTWKQYRKLVRYRILPYVY